MIPPLAASAADNAYLQGAIVVLTFLGIAIFWIRARRRSQSQGDGNHGMTQRKPAPDTPEKAAALDKFKAAHSKARDSLAKAQQGIEQDPARATKAFRNMMKRD